MVPKRRLLVSFPWPITSFSGTNFIIGEESQEEGINAVMPTFWGKFFSLENAKGYAIFIGLHLLSLLHSEMCRYFESSFDHLMSTKLLQNPLKLATL